MDLVREDAGEGCHLDLRNPTKQQKN